MVKLLERRYQETASEDVRADIERFMRERACPGCGGSRLRPETLSVKIAGRSIADVVRFTAYVTDRAYFPVYGAVRGRYVSGSAFASTLVIVSGFTRPEFKVEVEVTAVAS